MAIKRSYTTTVTFKTGYGDALTLSGKDAEAVYSQFKAYIQGGYAPMGFEVLSSDGSACLYLYEAVAKVCRSAQTETQTTDGECEDLDCDLQPVKTTTSTTETGQTGS